MGERAVYYCRVSTEEENQLTSVISQKEESMRTIWENGWTLIKGYVDEGKSGTTIRHRDEYNRMIQDMEEDRFDILVVKSQDRLMRNTREWYLFLDRLTRKKKRLYFYLERKFYSPEDALLTGIRAILAEDFSRSLSRNINHAHERRQRTGSKVILTSHTWGYDNVAGRIMINEKEAKMIKDIYAAAEKGMGSRRIAGVLADAGYQNRRGGLIAEQTIRRILRNPLYKGTAVMHRQHQEFENKQVEYLSREQWIFHEGAVPAIIAEEQWEKVNRQMDQRRVCLVDETEGKRKNFRGKRQGQFLLSGKMTCGLCGSPYWRRGRKLTHGKQYYWSCSRFLTAGRGEKGCGNIHIKENDWMGIWEKIPHKRGSDLTRISVNPGRLMITLTDQTEIIVEVEQVNQYKRNYRVCL